MSRAPTCLCFQSYLIGEVRLRQVRIDDNKCSAYQRDVLSMERCERAYSLSIEDDGDYKRGWLKPNVSSMFRLFCFVYAIHGIHFADMFW